MRRIALAVSLALLGAGAVVGADGASAVVVPLNDLQANAIVVASLPASISANNNGATKTSGDRWNNTVWYSYTAASNGHVAVRASSPGVFDNTLEVWTGGALVVQNDDFYGLDAMLHFPVTSGTTYLIGLGSYSNGRTGAATLTMSDQPPDAPAAPSAVPGDGQAAVSWTAPADNGMAITGYTVRAYTGGSLVTTVLVAGTPPGTARTVTGLTNGTTYTFTVSATNLIGSSSESPTVAATPAGLPGAPLSVAAAAGDSSLAFTWAPPVSTGGSSISGYTVTLSPGGAICTAATGQTCTVTGLTNGASYDATVHATNGVGAGPESAAVTAVPVLTVPSTPDPITPPAPATPPTVTAVVADPTHTIVPASGAFIVGCSVSAGDVTACQVSLYATVHGRRVLVGTGTGAGTVLVHLNARGQRLVSAPGGRVFTAVAALSVTGVDHLLQAETAVTAVGHRVVLSHTVRFAGSRVDVGPSAQRWLRSVRGRIAGARTITCTGYTSNRGGAAFREQLALTRAQAVCRLLAQGRQVTTRVLNGGAGHPVATNATAAGRRANRRVDIVLGY